MEELSVFRLIFFLFWFNQNTETHCFGKEVKQPKQTDLFQNEPKWTKKGLKNSNSTQKNALFSAAVSKTNQNKQICFKMNRNKPKMALKIAIAPKKCSLSSCSFRNKPKKTDLFQNEPKQTENGLKIIISTQKTFSFQLQFPKQTETKWKMAPKLK